MTESSSTTATSTTATAFSAFYLQRATAELAADLDQLRTAPDFAGSGDRSSSTAAGAGTTASSKASAAPHPSDNPLQMLVGALRQGAELFSATEQARVVGGGAEEEELEEDSGK